MQAKKYITNNMWFYTPRWINFANQVGPEELTLLQAQDANIMLDEVYEYML